MKISSNPLSPKGIWSGSLPNVMDLFIVLIFASVSFLCFDQAFDMRLTMIQSSDLLDCVFNGTPFHFYQHVLDKAVGGAYFGLNETSTVAIYNIILYSSLAIWLLPIYVLNHVTHLVIYEALINLWGRVLVISISLICAVVIRRFYIKLFSDPVKAKWAGYFFISSPLVLYCVVITDQFDIIPTILTLLALFFYFDKKYYKFSILMSLTICFKLFPLLIFFPLIFLVEKRLQKLFQYSAIAVALYAVTSIASSLFDTGYNQMQKIAQVQHGYFDRIYTAQIPGGIKNISLFLLCMILICTFAYYIKVSEIDLPMVAFLFCAASYASLFTFVLWEPQWFILILPFFIFIVFRMKNFVTGVLLETMISAGFLLVSVPIFLVRQHMTTSVLVALTKNIFSIPEHLYLPSLYFKQLGEGVLPMSIFVGFMAAFLLIAYKDYRSGIPADDSFTKDIRTVRILLYFRSSLILIYILPPLIAYFSTPAM